MNGYDVVYSIGLGLSAPFWLIRGTSRSKVRRAFRERMGPIATRDASRPAVLIHAVSLGEINATRSMIEMLRSIRPDADFILASTTDTGFARAAELYGNLSYVTVIRYPLDFTSAVTRVLDGLAPTVVVLMELEVWPNFISQCRKRNIPVLLVNGRLTAASFSRYSWARPLVRGMFSRLNWVCAQDQTYAERFVALGVDKDRIAVTGTMKFDTAQIAGNVPGDLLLADQVGLVPGKDLIWVCGSTGPGEEQLILAQYRQLLTRYSRLRLVLVPRKPERFDEVADLIRSMKFSVVRRSRKTIPPPGPLPHVVLGDTMGELRKFYSIADVVFVGRTLVDLGARQHGSDMIEPAALAKPIIVGPFTGNFAEPMARFTAAEAIHVVADAAELGQAIAGVLSTPYQSRTMAERAQDTVRREQGATTRNVRCILDYLGELAPAPKHPEHAPVRLDIVAEPAAIVTMAPTPAPERPKTHAAAEAPAKPVYMSINAANDGGQ